jgi:hypothetical protein
MHGSPQLSAKGQRVCAMRTTSGSPMMPSMPRRRQRPRRLVVTIREQNRARRSAAGYGHFGIVAIGSPFAGRRTRGVVVDCKNAKVELPTASGSSFRGGKLRKGGSGAPWGEDRVPPHLLGRGKRSGRPSAPWCHSGPAFCEARGVSRTPTVTASGSNSCGRHTHRQCLGVL